MTEHLPVSPEFKRPTPEAAPEAERRQPEKLPAGETVEQSSENLNRLRQTAEAQAASAKEVTIGERESTEPTPLGMQRELKSQAYNRTLQTVRARLPASARLFSRVVHQPVIETLSNVGAKTIARPSGVLSGSLVALVGSGVLLYMARYYGFAYNYSIFFALFGGGFIVGLLIEFTARLLRKRST